MTINRFLFNFSSIFLVLTTFGFTIFGLTVYFSHAVLAGVFFSNLPSFFRKIFLWDGYKVTLFLLIISALLMSAFQTSVTMSLLLLLKLGTLFVLYLLFLKGLIHYGPNFLYSGVWVAFFYMVYQSISWNFFDGNLAFSLAYTLPFSHQDYGLQVTKIYGLFGLGDNYITNLMQPLMWFTKFLGYKFSGLAQEMSYMSAAVFPLLFLPISKRLKIAILFILFFSLSKSIIGATFFLLMYQGLVYFLPKRVSAITVMMLFVIIVFFISNHLVEIVPGTSVAARFYPLVYFVNEMDFFEQVFGLGFGYSVHHLPYIYENKILSSLGSVLIFHGFLGLIAYLLFFVILIKGSRHPAFVLAIFLCMYNWLYSISWPILSMFYALNYYYSNIYKTEHNN